MTAYEPAWLLFASDAKIAALAGVGLVAAAVLAGIMDRRRIGRDRLDSPDRVGWMPWTLVSLLCAVGGAGLFAAALPGLLGR